MLAKVTKSIKQTCEYINQVNQINCVIIVNN
jgi:hypothetical protein